MFAQPGLFGTGIGRLGLGAGALTLVAQALAILAKYGSAANLYLPGVGQINGLQAGNWLDSAGTTVATVDNPVGLVVSAGKAVGPNVFSDAAVGFQGESTRVSPGVYRVYSSTGVFSSVFVGGSILLPNKTYRLQFNVDSITSGALAIDGPIGSVLPVVSGGVGEKEVVVTMTTVTSLSIKRSASATDIQISNLRIEELPGAHLTQSTAANRPVLRRGLVNQLRRSADFANTDQWNATNLSFSSTVGPNGLSDATIITATNASGASLISSTVPPIATSEAVTVAYIVKATGDNYSRTLLLRNATTSTNFQAGSFYCLNGNVTGAGWQSTAIGNGWFIVTFTQSTGISAGNSLLAYAGYAGGPPQGGVGSAFVVHRIGLFAGTVTAQQIIDAGGIPVTTTAPASSANGPFSWQFDGVNDSFTSTLTTPGEGYCVGGALCTNSTFTHTLLGGSGADGDSTPGMWIVRQSTGAIRISVGNGTTRNSLLSQMSPVNTVFVASAGWNISQIFTGVNDAEVSTANTLNCATSRTISVGFNGLAMLGSLYAQLWILGFTPTPDERRILRRFIASLSGVAF